VGHVAGIGELRIHRKVLSENLRRGGVLGDILMLNLDVYYDFTQHQYKF
jgi:hypothetical protein